MTPEITADMLFREQKQLRICFSLMRLLLNFIATI